MQSFYDTVANYNADPSDKRAVDDMRVAYLRDITIERVQYEVLVRVAKMMRVDIPHWEFGCKYTLYTCGASVLRSSDGYISAYNCDIDQYKTQQKRLMHLIEQKAAKNSGIVEGLNARIRIDDVKLNDQTELIHEHEHTIDQQAEQIKSLENKVKDCNQANGELIARIVRLENSKCERVEKTTEPDMSKLQYESLIGETTMKIGVLDKTIKKQVGIILTLKDERAKSIKMSSDRLELINELNKKIEAITQLHTDMSKCLND